jgi:hypothetical protein
MGGRRCGDRLICESLRREVARRNPGVIAWRSVSRKSSGGDSVVQDHLAVLLEGRSFEVGTVLRRARALVLDVIPDATEQVDLPDHLVAFGVGADGVIRLRDLLIALVAHTAYVNVQFADGAMLPDPAGLLEGTGKRARHVKCRTVADVERPAVRALIQAEAALHGRT